MPIIAQEKSLVRLSFQIAIIRNLGHELPAPRVIIEAKADMLGSVTHDEILHVELRVVRENLMQHLLRYLDIRRLILKYHTWLHAVIIKH